MRASRKGVLEIPKIKRSVSGWIHSFSIHKINHTEFI